MTTCSIILIGVIASEGIFDNERDVTYCVRLVLEDSFAAYEMLWGPRVDKFRVNDAFLPIAK